jgi:hypothetical protein
MWVVMSTSPKTCLLVFLKCQAKVAFSAIISFHTTLFLFYFQIASKPILKTIIKMVIGKMIMIIKRPLLNGDQKRLTLFDVD